MYYPNASLMTTPHAPSAIDAQDQRDIDELTRRITRFQTGQEDEERFKHYRLTRGVYGQRQSGVQMFRIKIPYGRLNTAQLVRIADLAETYTNARLHLTTRQNIQMHYVRLSDSPAIWTGLAEVGLHAREACGNTVRTVTASATAGIDPAEAFDVGPYARATTDYFLRNPICQEMGRKVKIAFSGSEADSAFTYFHDFGFIARIREGQRGFKVVAGGGLGAVSMVAQTVAEFMPADEILPFMEAAIRVFDRYGERQKRMKARMKFLVKKLGLAGFLELVEREKSGLARTSIPILVPEPEKPELPADSGQQPDFSDPQALVTWQKTNVLIQKQPNYRAVQIRVPLGNLTSETARQLAGLVRRYAADDLRITVNQGLLVRYLRPERLPEFYRGLQQIGLDAPGFDSTADVTACPGTDTCALGVTNSTGLAGKLETVIHTEFPEYVSAQHLRIKISGCMNSCGQHMAAQIGFHGSSLRRDQLLIPAMQVVLGGGIHPDGRGFIADKVIKVPTRRIPQVLRTLLSDYEAHAMEGQYFLDYYQQRGKKYFYTLLKPLADTETVTDDELVDWGQESAYRQSIGVGECAGATLDLVGTILQEAADKRREAAEAAAAEKWDFAAYHAYTSLVIGAKALLLAKDVSCNTHKGILQDFSEHYGPVIKDWAGIGDFAAFVLRIRDQAPTQAFVSAFLAQASEILDQMLALRQKQLSETGQDKLVIENYYKA